MEKTETKKYSEFTDLTTWKEGHRLALLVYELTKKFPKDEVFSLTNQLRRAAVSITSNIAEGFGRRHVKEKVQFWQIAIGSIYEVENQLILSRDIGYITANDYNKAKDLLISSKKLCYSLINSMTKSSI